LSQRALAALGRPRRASGLGEVKAAYRRLTVEQRLRFADWLAAARPTTPNRKQSDLNAITTQKGKSPGRKLRMQRRKSRKRPPPLQSLRREPLRTFKVFVHHKAPGVSRPFLLCVEIGLPAHQEPHAEIIQASGFASKAKLGDMRQLVA